MLLGLLSKGYSIGLTLGKAAWGKIKVVSRFLCSGVRDLIKAAIAEPAKAVIIILGFGTSMYDVKLGVGAGLTFLITAYGLNRGRIRPNTK